ncbi:hypothetical protein [Hymenobacter sp. BRD67]|uniref:hypothetical protein n=1 Tax=Hymenobacter sp. BRD67 TaxID=2675877 RepID=UPI0015642B14|nr:hypothetical protein [Hymenobacter sp. BRD67]QKG53973.1 hypothetical protein GKZ67_16905 [Hymenobacter sp. BRD67]
MKNKEAEDKAKGPGNKVFLESGESEGFVIAAIQDVQQHNKYKQLLKLMVSIFAFSAKSKCKLPL